MEKAKKIKKYLFYISIFFIFVLWTHITNLYLYHNAEIEPTEWWTVSEGFIWDFPTLNPLINSNDYNLYINSLLYRSVLTYDQEGKKIVWDIANCDIRNLAYIECFINDNAKWSNWTDITTWDIISTYNIIKKYNLNPTLNTILENTTIEERAGVIIFSNRKKNINFINLLFQPIVSEQVLNKLTERQLTWSFDPSNWIYSNRYIVDSIWYDDASKIKKLVLVKNDMFINNESLISRIVLKFFKNTPHFLKYKDSVNIFLDKDNIISWSTTPRFKKYEYTLPQYFAAFINKERIKEKELRTILLNNIDRSSILETLWKWYEWVQNPFLIENNDIDDNIKDISIQEELNKLWYYKSDNLVEKNIEKQNKDYIEKTFNDNNYKVDYITNEWINNKINFIKEDNILLKWDVLDKNPSEVYINDYKLKSYKSWDKYFYYRLKESYDNIKEWVNKYEIKFTINGEQEVIESIQIIYHKDEEKLENEKDKILSQYSKELEKNEKSLDTTEIEKEVERLDPKYFYNSDNEKFTLNLMYLDSQKEWSIIAENIKNNYNKIGIEVNINPINISSLNEIVTSWNKDYDIILVWINLGYFDFNIFPYFHSSQVKNWYNFSNIKKPWLDYVLEELKSKILTESKTDDLKIKVLELIKEEQIVKTIFTPVIYNLVDNNIKNYNLGEKINSSIIRKNSIFNAYISSKKNIKFEEKSILDFISFIFDIIKKND